jgi:hypothetical protein
LARVAGEKKSTVLFGTKAGEAFHLMTFVVTAGWLVQTLRFLWTGEGRLTIRASAGVIAPDLQLDWGCCPFFSYEQD